MKKVVDATVVMKRQVPTIQSVQKMVEVPQDPFFDRVVDVLVMMKR